MLPADSSSPSALSSSRFTPETVVFTSERRGTVSSRIPSMSILVDSRTRNRFTRTSPRMSTSTAHATAATRPATPPTLIDATTFALPSSGFACFEAGIITGLLGRIPCFPWSFCFCLFPLARRLVIPLALEGGRPVLLVDLVSGIVVWVLVALAVPELAEPRMARRFLQMKRDGVRRCRVLGGSAEGCDDAVGLGQSHVLDRLGRRHGDEQGTRIGQADVLGSVHDHTPGDVPRVLARLKHPGQPEQRGVGIRTADALDEGGDDVVVGVSL